jgi:ubiquinone/menaquinone biosynthesis C-methylase UbiE
MRRQDWAFLGALGGLVAAGVALLVGSTLWAGALALAVAVIAVAARQWSRTQPGPMSHALSWVLRLPRGPHSPSRLIRILGPLPRERILEVGPGIGIHAVPIAKAIEPGGTLDAIDVQDTMILDLSARAEAAGIKNIVPACGDATKLAYTDATFDAAFLITVLGEIPDQDAALRELRRVIKPSGRLIIGEMIVDPDFIPLRELRDRAARAGFLFERNSGSSLAYLARFRPQ